MTDGNLMVGPLAVEVISANEHPFYRGYVAALKRATAIAGRTNDAVGILKDLGAALVEAEHSLKSIEAANERRDPVREEESPSVGQDPVDAGSSDADAGD